MGKTALRVWFFQVLILVMEQDFASCERATDIFAALGALAVALAVAL
jgi:hypothetical protein